MMNAFLLVIQILLALHTIMGAVWKFSNPEQLAALLGIIPHSVWIVLSVFEILCALALIVAVFKQRLAKWGVIGAAGVAAEMLVFCGINLSSATPWYGGVIYWLVVAAFCGILIYGRLVLKRS
jgi:hypothetical protein